jgi:hypothetical protein
VRDKPEAPRSSCLLKPPCVSASSPQCGIGSPH